MENQIESKQGSQADSLKNLYIFQDLFKFTREHTGLAFTTAYLTLILSSMTYLYVLFSAFDISIVKFISLEDILATPIKNPNIILVFTAIIFVLFISELGNRWNVRMSEKYKDSKSPFLVRILRIIVWVPKSRKRNIQFTTLISIFFIAIYVITFAKFEARDIKKGEGAQYQITVAENEQSFERMLIGASSQFIYTYDLKSKESGIYHVESILKMQPVVKSKSLVKEQTHKPIDENLAEEEKTKTTNNPDN